MNNHQAENEAVGAVAVRPSSQLITLDPAKYVTEVFQPFKDKFAILKAEADTIIPDVTTTAGMEIAVKYRAAFRDEVRIAGEKARAERKAPILEIGKLLDSKYKDLLAEVAPYEAKFHDAIKAEEKRKEDLKKAEAERQEAIRLRIVAIRDLLLQAVGKSAADISAMIAELDANAPDESFGIMLDAALTARTEVQGKLANLHTAAVAAEEEVARIAAERAELAALREAAAERARLAQIEADRVAAQQKAEADRLAALAAEQEAAALREREAAAMKLKQEAEAQAEANRKAQAEIDRQRAELVAQQEAAERARVAAETKAQLEAQQAAIAERQANERAAAALDQQNRDAALEATRRAASDAAAANVTADALAEQGRLTDMADQVVREEQANTPPSLRLGQINERIAPLQISAEGLRALGFEHVTDKGSKLYHEHQFPSMCAAMCRHIAAARAKYSVSEEVAA